MLKNINFLHLVESKKKKASEGASPPHSLSSRLHQVVCIKYMKQIYCNNNVVKKHYSEPLILKKETQ